MSAVSVVPAAARLPRSVGGRRVLQTLLLLGGLLALAFLFGGSAQAASGPALPDGAVTDGPVKSGKAANALTDQLDPGSFKDEFDENRRESQAAGHEATGRVTEPVVKGAERAKKAARPVGDTVSGVTDAVDLDEVTDRVVPGARSEDTSGSDENDSAGHRTDGKRDDSSGAASHIPDKAAQHAASLPAPALPDDARTSHVSPGDGPDHGSDQGGPGGRGPLHDAPCVLVAPSAQSAGDGRSGPRGGADQPAAYISDMERFCLLRSGAVSAAEGTPTRDRSAEILEFPG